jgi:hypothetical protein
MLHGFTEHRARLVDRVSCPQHALDALIVFRPLLDLVEINSACRRRSARWSPRSTSRSYPADQDALGVAGAEPQPLDGKLTRARLVFGIDDPAVATELDKTAAES